MSVNTPLLSFEKALESILVIAKPLSSSEEIPLSIATGRVLAHPIISNLNIPSFDNSAMDGYAVRLSDFNQHTNPILSQAGKSLAGHPFTGEWREGQCIRIMTGAPVPREADAVVMQEETEVTPDGIKFKASIKKGQNIRYTGEEISIGQTIFTSGTRLGISSIALLASLGINSVCVYKKLKVAIFSTGDELQSIGMPLAPGQIYDTNRLSVKMMLEKLGCDIIDLGIIADDPKLIEDAFTKADKQADVVISSGGVSVGEADYTKQVLDQLGNIEFWKIAMKPGKPFAFGKLNNSIFCGLPGNPVSAMVTFYQLVQPLLMKMSGFSQWKPPAQFKVKTITDIKKTPGRLDFQRGILITNNQTGELEVSPAGHQGSHILSSIHQGNCFIVLEQERGRVSAGELVTVEPFNMLLQD